MIRYRVDLESPGSHYLKVTLSYSKELASGDCLWLPDWIPGSYMIRDFARNIVQISASSENQPVPLTKISKSSWVLSRNVIDLEVVYTIYAWDLSVRSAHFDDQHCFFNGTSLFLAIAGKEQSEHLVQLCEPEFESAKRWSVATSMNAISVNSNGFGDYSSDSYAELIDHPFEIAELDRVSFNIFGVEHSMVFTEAPKNVDYQRIASDVEAICRHQCEMFGDATPPFNSYLFMTFVLKQGFGGLEHRASTALQCSHADLPRVYDDKHKKSDEYQRFLALCSHEYFHSWNVKRIKPQRFEDYQLRGEVHTELLWFFEGITSYYDELVLVRSGVIELEQYLDMLAKNITRYMRGKGRSRQTVAESSFDAWTKFYKQDENAVNSIVSYYVKGGLIAMLLDFKIRECTDKEKNLDDLMRLIWQKNGKTKLGVEEKQINRYLEIVCDQNIDSFVARLLYSTDELPLSVLFQELGIEYRLQSEAKQLETGGYVESFAELSSPSSLGVVAKVHSLGAELVSVYEDSSAAKSGLSNKDIIIAIDGYRVSFEQLDKTIAKYPVNSEVEISFFRRDKLHRRLCRLNPLTPNVCYLTTDKGNLKPELKTWLNLDSK